MIPNAKMLKWSIRTICVGMTFLAAACADLVRPPAPPPPQADLTESLPIFVGSDALVEKWRRVQVWGKSDWRLIAMDGDVVIEPVVDRSSTALARWIEFDTLKCPVAEWIWRVDALPPGADLTTRKAEDVAASVFFVFGDPGTFSNPEPVPTIRYVWSAGDEAAGTVINSPYFPDNLRNIVVRSGGAGAGWVTEQRNLHEDYVRAFGQPPSDRVQVFALFTDNDHLGEPVKAFYLSARMLCSELPETGVLF